MKYVLLLLTSMIIMSCSPRHQLIKILYFSKDSTDVHANKLKNEGKKNGWRIIVTNDEHYFHEDSLSQMNAVFLPFSSLNQLGYKSVPALKRYLEAGGGGIVTLRDTLLNQAQWPWLQSWNEQKDSVEWTQDQDRLNWLKKGLQGRRSEKIFILYHREKPGSRLYKSKNFECSG